MTTPAQRLQVSRIAWRAALVDWDDVVDLHYGDSMGAALAQRPPGQLPASENFPVPCVVEAHGLTVGLCGGYRGPLRLSVARRQTGCHLGPGPAPPSRRNPG